MWYKRFLASSLIVFLCAVSLPVSIARADTNSEQVSRERKVLFEHMQTITGVPWQYLAAVDQYERSVRKPNKKTEGSSPSQTRLTGISVPPAIWSGVLNPLDTDVNPRSIAFFGGIGKDGDGDGKADPHNDLDVVYTIACYLEQFGFTDNDLRIGLWQYYTYDRSVRTISGLVKLYRHHNTLHLVGSAFPVPLHYDYSYKSTWGDPRGWGGRRIHEGTDIFAGYGTPVRATRHGVIESMGWNPYGGWRIGVRDVDTIYHYYAHLNGFNKKFKVGDVVAPGDVIGYVGSSGYGKPGTSGKFPPHLHYGIYKDRGNGEYSFDPYPSLKRWENEEQKKLAQKKKR